MPKKIIGFIKVHIKDNLFIYSLVILCFLIGVSIGGFIIKIINQQQKEELFYYLKNYLQFFNETELNNYHIFKLSFMNNFKLLILTWISSLFIITFPLIFCIIIFKGFVIGFTIVLLIENFKLGGLLFFTFAVLFQNIILIIVFIMASVHSISFSLNFIKIEFYKKKKTKINKNLFTYTSMYIVFIALILFSALIEAYISPILIQILIKYIL
ncbi:MAG: stage II sporulation protein M [Clostridiales bacterium]|nr:stage II sporulation protein M [Clostridiales bacterium]